MKKAEKLMIYDDTSYQKMLGNYFTLTPHIWSSTNIIQMNPLLIFMEVFREAQQSTLSWVPIESVSIWNKMITHDSLTMLFCSEMLENVGKLSKVKWFKHVGQLLTILDRNPKVQNILYVSNISKTFPKRLRYKNML